MSAPRSRMNGPMRRSSSSSWGMVSSRCSFHCSNASLVGHGQAPLPYRYGIRYGSFEASAVGVVASHRL